MMKILAALLLSIPLSVDTSIAATPNLPDAKEFKCLVKNIYHEARGESVEGQKAVGLVTLNRVRDPRYPKTICKVVYQPMQFSWTSNPTVSAKVNSKAWNQAVYAATYAYNSTSKFRATHYHNLTVRPNWKLTKIAKIGNHIFYA